MRDLHRKGYTRATLSGDAWACAREMIGSSDGQRHASYLKWDKYFPRLSIALDSALRPGYFGGVNYSANPGTHEGGIVHFDIHNSYGSVMMWARMPYGIPTETEDWPRESDLFIANVRIKLKLREGLRPWFQFKNGTDNIIEGWEHGTLVTETKEFHVLTLSSVDLDILDDWYEIEFDDEFDERFWVFQSKEGLLAPYIE